MLIVTNNEDTAIVLKNLTIQPLKDPNQSPESNGETTSNSGMLASLAYFSALLITTFAAAIVYVKKMNEE